MAERPAVIVALIAGLLIGSVPTADWLARATGLSLRDAGSGNPGTNNALRLGGPGLALRVLVIEVAKGVLAVWLGSVVGGAPGAAVAGVAATVGNVYNPWFRGRGGKGLAITAGVLLAAWPLWFLTATVTIAGALAIMRRTGPASIAALVVVSALALVGLSGPVATGWMIADPQWAAVVALGCSLVILPKQIRDMRRSP